MTPYLCSNLLIRSIRYTLNLIHGFTLLCSLPLMKRREHIVLLYIMVILQWTKLKRYCVDYASSIIKREIGQGSQDSHSLHCSEVPKTMLRLNNLPEGFTELRKAFILIIIIYYTKRIETKISQGKRTENSILEFASVSFPLLPPHGGVQTAPVSPATTGENACGVLAIREGHSSLVSSFYGGLVICSWVTPCPADLVSSPSRG